MTANAMKADLDACLAAGMNDYVIKPIDRQALLQTLRRWLPAGTGGEATRGGRRGRSSAAAASHALARRPRHHRHAAAARPGLRHAEAHARAVCRRTGANSGRAARGRRVRRRSRGRAARTCDCRSGRKPRRRRVAGRGQSPRARRSSGAHGPCWRCSPRSNGARRRRLSIDRHVARRRSRPCRR